MTNLCSRNAKKTIASKVDVKYLFDLHQYYVMKNQEKNGIKLIESKRTNILNKIKEMPFTQDEIDTTLHEFLQQTFKFTQKSIKSGVKYEVCSEISLLQYAMMRIFSGAW